MPSLRFQPFYSRPTLGLAEFECLNVVSEQSPQGTIFPSRPALTRRTINVGTGPIRGIERQPGVAYSSTLSIDSLLIVSGKQLYRRETLIGTIDGTAQVRFAASSTELVIVAPDVGKAYLYRTSDHSLHQITDPDLPEVSDVFEMDSRFYYQEKGSDRWWFSALDDAGSIDGLAFETSEAKPDFTVRATTFKHLACFFGQSSIEVFSSSGDPNAPLAPQVTMTIDKGLAAPDSLVLVGDALFFVGFDRVVYAYTGGAPVKVSFGGINERLRKCDSIEDVTAYAQSWDGHEGPIFNIPGQGSFFYDLTSKQWFRWQSGALSRMRISTGIMYGGESWLGDYETGQIWRLNPDGLQDYTDRITRMVTAFLPVESGNPRCDVIALQCVRGEGDTQTPYVEMRYSDNGRTWGPWQPRSLGKVGEYDEKAVWRQQGLMRSPGRLIQFRTSEQLIFVAESVTIDEQRP